MSSSSLSWPNLNQVLNSISLEPKQTLSVLEQTDIPVIVEKLSTWFPDLQVGEEKCFLDPEFYLQKTLLNNQQSINKILPVVLKYDNKIIAFVSFEKFSTSPVLKSRIGAIAPEFRGKSIATIGPILLEKLGRAMGAGLIYYYATLKIPQQQIVAEKLDFIPVGFLPAYNLAYSKNTETQLFDIIIYAKVLAKGSQVATLNLHHCTEKTKALYNIIFQESFNLGNQYAREPF